MQQNIFLLRLQSQLHKLTSITTAQNETLILASRHQSPSLQSFFYQENHLQHHLSLSTSVYIDRYAQRLDRKSGWYSYIHGSDLQMFTSSFQK